MMVERPATLRHEEIDPGLKQLESKVASRRTLTEEWLYDYLPQYGYDVRHIMAASFNAATFRFLSRYWACRGLATFTSIRQEEETTEACDDMDADGSVLDVVKLRFAND